MIMQMAGRGHFKIAVIWKLGFPACRIPVRT